MCMIIKVRVAFWAQVEGTWRDIFAASPIPLPSCVISKENCIVGAGRRNMRRDFCSFTHRIAIPMKVGTQWTHCDVWGQSATTPEWSIKIGNRHKEKKSWNSDQRVIWNATRWISAGWGDICPQGVSNGFDGARALQQSHSARTELFFADAAAVFQGAFSIAQVILHDWRWKTCLKLIGQIPAAWKALWILCLVWTFVWAQVTSLLYISE